MLVVKAETAPIVIEMYLETWQTEGESIPEPTTLQVV